MGHNIALSKLSLKGDKNQKNTDNNSINEKSLSVSPEDIELSFKENMMNCNHYIVPYNWELSGKHNTSEILDQINRYMHNTSFNLGQELQDSYKHINQHIEHLDSIISKLTKHKLDGFDSENTVGSRYKIILSLKSAACSIQKLCMMIIQIKKDIDKIENENNNDKHNSKKKKLVYLTKSYLKEHRKELDKIKSDIITDLGFCAFNLLESDSKNVGSLNDHYKELLDIAMIVQCHNGKLLSDLLSKTLNNLSIEDYEKLMNINSNDSIFIVESLKQQKQQKKLLDKSYLHLYAQSLMHKHEDIRPYYKNNTFTLSDRKQCIKLIKRCLSKKRSLGDALNTLQGANNIMHKKPYIIKSMNEVSKNIHDCMVYMDQMFRLCHSRLDKTQKTDYLSKYGIWFGMHCLSRSIAIDIDQHQNNFSFDDKEINIETLNDLLTIRDLYVLDVEINNTIKRSYEALSIFKNQIKNIEQIISELKSLINNSKAELISNNEAENKELVNDIKLVIVILEKMHSTAAEIFDNIVSSVYFIHHKQILLWTIISRLVRQVNKAGNNKIIHFLTKIIGITFLNVS